MTSSSCLETVVVVCAGAWTATEVLLLVAEITVFLFLVGLVLGLCKHNRSKHYLKTLLWRTKIQEMRKCVKCSEFDLTFNTENYNFSELNLTH